MMISEVKFAVKLNNLQTSFTVVSTVDGLSTRIDIQVDGNWHT